MSSKPFSLLSAIPLVAPGVSTRNHRNSRASALALPRHTSVGLILLALAAVLMVFYVFGINRHAAMGYELKKQQAKVNSLIEQNKKLTVRAAETGSTLKLQEEVSLNNFVQITNQEYLQANQYSQR
jgi:hypothetical protein